MCVCERNSDLTLGSSLHAKVLRHKISVEVGKIALMADGSNF